MAMAFQLESQHPVFHGQLVEKRERDIEFERIQLVNYPEIGLALPVVLLKEVFQSLDTVDRQRCRRTCPLWEALFTSTELCQEVRAMQQPPHSSFPEQWNSRYALYCCVFKLITPATRIIFINVAETNYTSHCNPDFAEELLDVIAAVLNGAGMHIDRLIIHQRSIRLETAYRGGQFNWSAQSAEIAAVTAKLLSCCGRVIWKDYVFTLADMGRLLVMTSRIPLAVFTRAPLDGAHIMDLWEQYLGCEGQPLDVQHIAHCLANRVNNEVKAMKVMQILQDYQSGDPRHRRTIEIFSGRCTAWPTWTWAN
ncbi:uncharacterized protein LOC129581354 [Paramacrobiotus metropolitanus]|uniref:uncharacterized protein LOC129581354 n=1 Tax=Paramacrobiotus metropolitanus TaxID=2943436 RepID=UPI0024463556|nr:uncharacterized protein LOC129581354 [Paramacrobiotus metropolitanus]